MAVALTKGVTLGGDMTRGGCVTRLLDILGRSPEDLEDIIGYHRGRLSMGYYIAVLMEPLKAGEFIYAGYTTWSGGRWGLPDPHKRPHVEKMRSSIHHDLQMKLGTDASGKKAMEEMQKHTVANIPLKGVERLAKCVPVIDHNSDMDKDPTLPVQYPRGAGIKQYILTTGKKFLVAAEVKPDGTLHGIDGFSTQLATGMRYEERVRLRQYMETVPKPKAVV